MGTLRRQARKRRPPVQRTSSNGQANDKKADPAQTTKTVANTRVIGTSYDDMGNKTTVTQTTTVTFSTAKGHEGEFRDATIQTAVHAGEAYDRVVAQSGEVCVCVKSCKGGASWRYVEAAHNGAAAEFRGWNQSCRRPVFCVRRGGLGTREFN
jgi:hypothetical protein